MVVEVAKKVVLVKRAVARKVGKKVAGGEALMHLFYGGAVFTEIKHEITIYAVAAIGLGIFAVLAFVFGKEGE